MSVAYESPKKVCVICHGLGSGGIESFVVNLAKGLKARKYDVKLAMALDEKGIQQFREKEIENAGIEMFRTCDLGSLKRLYKHSIRLFYYLKENQFDIVHSNMSLLNGLNLAIAWLAGVKIRVAHAHAIGSERSAHGKLNILDYIYQRVMRSMISIFANRKCGCSQAVVEDSYGKQRVNQLNIYVVNNGVDLSVFTPRDQTAHNTKTLITVGRLAPVKNPQLIIQIMCILKDKGYTLNWVGGGELEADINKEIHRLNLSSCINMMGTRKDVNLLLQAANAFLLPSFSEGLSIATIEAQAVGLPCIVSDAIPEEVNCGLCKFVSLKESPEKWAEAIDDIVCRKEKLSLDMRLLKRFSTDYMVERICSIYEKEE